MFLHKKTETAFDTILNDKLSADSAATGAFSDPSVHKKIGDKCEQTKSDPRVSHLVTEIPEATQANIEVTIGDGNEAGTLDGVGTEGSPLCDPVTGELAEEIFATVRAWLMRS